MKENLLKNNENSNKIDSSSFFQEVCKKFILSFFRILKNLLAFSNELEFFYFFEQNKGKEFQNRF